MLMCEVKQEGDPTASPDGPDGDRAPGDMPEAGGDGSPGPGAEPGTDASNMYGDADVVNIAGNILGSQGGGMEHDADPESPKHLAASALNRSNQPLTRDQLVRTIMEGFPERASARQHAISLHSVCQVEGCGQQLCFLKEYHQRYRVCVEHLKCDHVETGGMKMRFCQQCGKFQGLDLFDEGKRSCRERLKKHNERRRKRVDARYAAAVMLQMTEGGGDGIAADELARRTAHPGQRDGRKQPPSAPPGNHQRGVPRRELQASDMPPMPAMPAMTAMPAMPAMTAMPPMPPMPRMPPMPSSAPARMATPIEHGMNMISEMVSYMMAVRSLSTITTDLETDVTSQISIGMVNMALNANVVPKVMPGPRIMELLLRNFAGAFRYELTSLALRPIPAQGSFRSTEDVDARETPRARAGAEFHGGHTEPVAKNDESVRVRRQIKRPKKLNDFEDPDWPEREGLEDLLNFASEAASE